MTGFKHLQRRGFTLIIAVILASVATAVGLALSSIAFKSVRLSDTSQSSSLAFYAADSALECALYADQQLNTFSYTGHASSPAITCAGPTAPQAIGFSVASAGASTLKYVSLSPTGYSGGWFPVSLLGCARITVFKSSAALTTLYAEGLNDCRTGNPRAVERGVYATY